MLPVYINDIVCDLGQEHPIEDLGKDGVPQDLIAAAHERGLRGFLRDDRQLDVSCASTLKTLLESNSISPDMIAAIIFNEGVLADGREARPFIFGALAGLGIENVPIYGVAGQASGAACIMFELARHHVATSTDNKVVLVLLLSRSDPAIRIAPGGVGVFSDGVCAAIFSKEPGRYQLLAVSSVSNMWAGSMPLSEVGSHFPRIISTARSQLERVASDVYMQAGVQAGDIAMLFGTNSNFAFLQMAATAAGIGENLIYDRDVARISHVGPCDNLIGLKGYLEHAQENDLVIILNWAQYVYSASLLKVCRL